MVAWLALQVVVRLAVPLVAYSALMMVAWMVD